MENSTQTNGITLLPCPFCGGEAQVLKDGLPYVVIECERCFCRTNCNATEAEAIEAWNTRAERTCHVEAFDDGMDEALDGCITSYSPPTWYLSCGHMSEGMEKPGYCPNCGAKVVGNGG